MAEGTGTNSVPELLDRALEQVDAPTALVGRVIPSKAREWAESRGLEVRVSEFAPRGDLFIIGALPVGFPESRIWCGWPEIAAAAESIRELVA